MHKIILTYGIVFMSFAIYGQSNAAYPDLMSVYWYNMASVSPGYVPDTGTFEAALSYKFRQGQLNKVSTLSFAAAKILRTEHNTHVLRVTMFNERQGPYITSPKAYMNYAYELRLRPEMRLYAGVSLGVSSIYFSAPTFSNSFYLPDGAFGLGLKYRQASVGVSTLQMLNATTSSMVHEYRLGRYYNLHGTVKKELNHHTQWNLLALWRILPTTRNDASLATYLTFHDKISFGAVLGYKAGMSFFSTVNVNTEQNKLVLSFGYNAAPVFSALPSWQNSMEINLGYTIY